MTAISVDHFQGPSVEDDPERQEHENPCQDTAVQAGNFEAHLDNTGIRLNLVKARETDPPTQTTFPIGWNVVMKTSGLDHQDNTR
jgi:hypothetical protein